MGLIRKLGRARRFVKAGCAALAVEKAHREGKKIKRNTRTAMYAERKDIITMKKSTFATVLALLAAVAGALGAMFLYLRRREAELNEYEQMLFSEDFSHEQRPAGENKPDGNEISLH